LRQNILTDRQ